MFKTATLSKASITTPRTGTVLESNDQHILLIDDETIIRDMGTAMLKKIGYRVTTCEDGQKAKQYFQEHYREVDLIILDLIMPRLSGEETFTLLKAINSDVPILISSGYAKNDTVTKLLDRGAAGFLSKPFRIADLSKEVHAALG